MRRLMKVRHLWVFELLMGLFCQLSQAGINYDKAISIEIKNLNRWKNSTEAPALQLALGGMIRQRPDNPRAPEFLRTVKPFAFLFSKPFLLLEAEPNPYGGFWGTVIFKDHPRVYGLWIFELGRDSNEWELREVLPFEIKMPKIIRHQLRDKRVKPFWLKASITW